MPFWIYPLIIVLLIVVLALVTLLTGHEKRSYPVLNASDTVEVAGKKLSVSRLAEMYKPKVYISSSISSPPLLWVWYEVVLNKDTLDIIYYHVWENEIHPNPIIHKIYSLFRALYYGYPLYDIEYFQVKINRSDGAVQGLMFETSPSEEYQQTFTRHIVVRMTRLDSGNYREVKMTTAGKLLSTRDNVAVKFDGTHVLVAAQTWNHVHCLKTETDDTYDVYVDAPLRVLSDKEYQRYKFSRKSQGEHKTK